MRTPAVKPAVLLTPLPASVVDPNCNKPLEDTLTDV